jgi:hypothetical protein|nr:MAG TPA: hypothetical protein [Caudoviricetes sp.]
MKCPYRKETNLIKTVETKKPLIHLLIVMKMNADCTVTKQKVALGQKRIKHRYLVQSSIHNNDKVKGIIK